MNNRLLRLVRFVNRVAGLKISDYYFYKWIRTKNEKYLEKYTTLTGKENGDETT